MDATVEVKRKLFPHQEIAKKFIEQRKFTLLADDMGLGKSLSALSTTDPESVNVIVCPKSLILNWKNEIEMTFNHPEIHIVDATTPPDLTKKKGYTIINYESLVKYQEIMMSYKPDTLILDESHYIKNYTTKRASASIALAKLSKRVICLTGTPLLTHVPDLFPYFVLAGYYPPVNRAYYAFLNTFTNKEEHKIKGRKIVKYTGLKNRDQLIKMMKNFTIRRTKDMVAELPPFTETIFFLSRYRDYEGDINLGTIAQNFELRQHIMKTRHTTALKKATDKNLYEFIDNILEQTDKLVIFVHHRDVAETVIRNLQKYRPVSISGKDDSEQRASALHRFKTDPECRVLVLSILAGGVGLNITNANYAVFLEMDWTYAVMEQAKARLHRIGQNNHVQIYYAVYDQSVDHLIARSIIAKELLTDEVNRGIEEKKI